LLAAEIRRLEFPRSTLENRTVPTDPIAVTPAPIALAKLASFHPTSPKDCMTPLHNSLTLIDGLVISKWGRLTTFRLAIECECGFDPAKRAGRLRHPSKGDLPEEEVRRTII
jgi:hypothetical protein